MAQTTRIATVLGAFLLSLCSGPVRADEKRPEPKNAVIIGASSMDGLPELLGALLEHGKTPTNVERGHFAPRDLERLWTSGKPWDFVILDAWQLTRGGTDAPAFPDAVAAFVKQARAHSPRCTIILFPWWLPSERATVEDAMKVFQSCVEAARPHGIWVATTGPAFMEARLARRDLNVTVSRQDAHPGRHGGYVNACSLYAIITGQSPVGLPATLKIGEQGKEFAIAAEDAKYMQELAWTVYQRELKQTKPGKGRSRQTERTPPPKGGGRL